MKYRRYAVRVEVALRAGVYDPQGELIARTLNRLQLGPVEGLRAGKVFSFEMEAPSAESAQQQAEEIAGRVLANPQLERYHCEVAPLPAGGEQGDERDRGSPPAPPLSTDPTPSH